MLGVTTRCAPSVVAASAKILRRFVGVCRGGAVQDCGSLGFAITPLAPGIATCRAVAECISDQSAVQ
jgi:hypothetical protein